MRVSIGGKWATAIALKRLITHAPSHCPISCPTRARSAPRVSYCRQPGYSLPPPALRPVNIPSAWIPHHVPSRIGAGQARVISIRLLSSLASSVWPDPFGGLGLSRKCNLCSFVTWRPVWIPESTPSRRPRSLRRWCHDHDRTPSPDAEHCRYPFSRTSASRRLFAQLPVQAVQTNSQIMRPLLLLRSGIP